MLSRNVGECWSINWSLWGHYQQSLPIAVLEQTIGGHDHRQRPCAGALRLRKPLVCLMQQKGRAIAAASGKGGPVPH